MREERVHQRSVRRAVRRVRHHPGGLVDDEQVAVFVHDVERDRFGLGVERTRRLDRVGDVVAGFEQGARLPGRAVHRCGARAQRGGDVRARESGQAREQDVEARPRLGVVDAVRQTLASRRSAAMTSSATPTVIDASAMLKTFGQIVLKSMKSTTH